MRFPFELSLHLSHLFHYSVCVQAELLELTRDARTVFVGQLVVRASEDNIRDYFEQVGPLTAPGMHTCSTSVSLLFFKSERIT